MDKSLSQKSPSTTILATNNESAANAALNEYFIDLTELDHTQEHHQGINDEYALKLNDAERLLKKAHSLSLLMNDRSLLAGEDEYAQDAVMPCERLSEQLCEQISEQLVEQTDSINHKEILDCAEIEDISGVRDAHIPLQEHLDEHFHVLLCEVAGLTLAIPLVELGGIHKITKISPIVGKPPWFMGLLIKGSDKYQCIDTARCIMPDKYNDELAAQLDYKFAVQLGKSPYAICCERISTTIMLKQQDIKWRANQVKRSWLAGLLKEKMCALIDGARMVQVVLGKMQ